MPANKNKTQDPQGGEYKKTDSAGYTDHIRKINDVFYDQIRIADQKAAYIFTFMLAFMISSAEGRGVFSLERYMQDNIPAALISALLAMAVVISLVSAILVVLPRSRVGSSTSLYWGTWAVHRQKLIEARERDDPDYILSEYLGNADNLADIARSKYKFVAIAFRGLVIAVIAYVLLLIFG